MKKISLLSVMFFCSIVVFAWGQIGHRTVGKVAENHLSKKAKEALACIMGTEGLVEASTWMDNIKSDSLYDHTHKWHYVTIPNEKDYHTCEVAKDGDAYESINRMVDIIKDANANKQEKIEAIRMLTHLVGDIHQPLHVGSGEDRGGNSVKIKWFYKNSNLHRIWDSGMIDSKQFSYSELAELIDHASESRVEELQKDNLDVWVKEAMDLRPQIYDIEGQENLSYEYQYKNWATVKDQLMKAGIRLAGILNEALDC
jgi:hypothetical protein